VVARVVGNQAKRSRTFRAASHAAATTAKAFGRVLHQLWLEVTGVVFLIMALSFAGATVTEYRKYHSGQVGLGRVTIAICFTVAFGWFGVTSFWRVKKKGRRGGAR
jgi:hypothetical protein